MPNSRAVQDFYGVKLLLSTAVHQAFIVSDLSHFDAVAISSN